MKVYRVLKTFIASFFVFYAGLGVLARIIHGPPGEIFPVFTWALFARVPNVKQDYALRLLKVGGENLEPAPYFENVGQEFKALGYAYYNTQTLGAAVSAEDADSIAKARRFFDRLYFGETTAVRYEIVERTFNPMDRWKSGTVKSVRTLGVFDSHLKEK